MPKARCEAAVAIILCGCERKVLLSSAALLLFRMNEVTLLPVMLPWREPLALGVFYSETESGFTFEK